MGSAFDRALPSAIAYGMSTDQFWWGDPWLYQAYREADRLAREREEWDRWVLGRYVYEALCRTSPLINPFSKSRRAHEWFERPIEAEGMEVDSKAPESPQEAEQVAHQMMIDWMLMHGPRGEG